MADYTLKLRCRKCNSDKLQKAGFIRYYTGKVEQRWVCPACKYHMTKLKKQK